MSALPARVQAQVQRILDAEARRLLAEQLDSDPIGTAAGADHGAGDGGPNQSAARVEGEPVPIVRGIDSDDSAVAA